MRHAKNISNIRMYFNEMAKRKLVYGIYRYLYSIHNSYMIWLVLNFIFTFTHFKFSLLIENMNLKWLPYTLHVLVVKKDDYEISSKKHVIVSKFHSCIPLSHVSLLSYFPLLKVMGRNRCSSIDIKRGGRNTCSSMPYTRHVRFWYWIYLKHACMEKKEEKKS